MSLDKNLQIHTYSWKIVLNPELFIQIFIDNTYYH